MSVALTVVVIGTLLIAVVVDLAALIAWLRRRLLVGAERGRTGKASP